MEAFTIPVREREVGGKSANGRIRKAGFIPGIAYHRAETPIKVEVPYKEFVQMAQKSRRSQVFTFKSDSPKLNGKSVIVKEIQKEHVKNLVLHIDFLTLKDDELISVDILLKFVGEAPGVKVEEGILTVSTHEVTVRCLPKNIPAAIEVDISKLNLGESIHGGDLNLPNGVVLSDDPHETIVSVLAPRTVEEAAPAAVEGAPVVAAAATPAAGDAKKAAPAGDAKK